MPADFISIGRRQKETIDVVSPFPDHRTQPHPRWYERLRGLFGIAAIVLITGVIAAAAFALLLVALAIFVATAFN